MIFSRISCIVAYSTFYKAILVSIVLVAAAIISSPVCIYVYLHVYTMQVCTHRSYIHRYIAIQVCTGIHIN